MKKLLLIISIFLFLPVLNAEENTYFDLPQEVVNELPVASESTLNKIYVLEDTYYITKEVSVGGTPTYLELNHDYNGTKIYFNGVSFVDLLQNNCPTGTWLKWATGTFSNSDFQYYIRQNCFNALTLNYLTFKQSNQTSEMTYTSTGAVFGYKNSGTYIEYFIPNSTFIITSVINQNIYHMFSLTDFVSSITYEWEQVNVNQVFRVRPEKIYVPSENLYCYHFINDDTLRGYVNNPVINNNVDYYDFKVNHHYRQSTGSELISELPVCLSNITTNYLYREDIFQVLGLAFLVGIIVIGIPLKLMLSFFKRRL